MRIKLRKTKREVKGFKSAIALFTRGREAQGISDLKQCRE